MRVNSSSTDEVSTNQAVKMAPERDASLATSRGNASPRKPLERVLDDPDRLGPWQERKVVADLAARSPSSPAADPRPTPLATEANVDPEEEEEAADSVRLCAAVRSLASHAYRTMKGTNGVAGDLHLETARLIEEIADVQRVIDQLRHHNLRLDELQRWLDRIRQQVVNNNN
jgi:hypothetical protein